MTEKPHEPTVVDGVLMRTSPSSLQKFSQCPRQWYYHYVANLPDKPPSKGMQRGTEGHARIAHYLSTGQNVLDPLELLGVERELIPMPNPMRAERGLPLALIEHEFRLPTRFGVPVIGAVDLIDKLNPVHWRLADWKFKRDIEKWGSSAASLVDATATEGIQMLSYAAVIKAMPDAPQEAEIQHITFQTQGRRDVKPTTVTISLDLAFTRWQIGVESAIPKLRAVAAEKVALNVWGNEKHCGAYGGCAYIEQCYDPMARIKASLKGLDAGSSLLGLKDQKEGNIMGILKRSSVAEQTVTPAKFAEVSVLPPDQPPTPMPTVGDFIIEGDTGPITPLQAEAIVVAAERAPEKIGKKPRSAPTPTVSTPLPPPSQMATQVAEALPVRQALAQAITELRNADFGVRIFIDCAPMGVKTENLTPIVEVLNDQIVKVSGLAVSDLRQANDNVFGFNRWKPYLAAHAVDQLLAGRIAPGDYVVFDGDERTRCVADALAARLPAGNVVVRVGR